MAEALDRGREAFERQAWAEAFDCLSAAEGEAALDADALVLLALAAGLSGRDDEAVAAWGRAHEEFLSGGDAPSAARCAIWLSMRLNYLLEYGRAGGWLARAQRILDESGDDCVERGLVLIPRAMAALNQGDPHAAQGLFERACETGERFRNSDVMAMARLGIGVCRVRSGATREGLACLDEVMVALEAREVSAHVAGIVYCAAIDECHEVFDLHRAQEWTGALTRWCAGQPELVPFQGQCQVLRARVMQLHGDWPDAQALVDSIASAPRRAAVAALGAAAYQRGELQRLRGELELAGQSYREASRYGHPPEPGLVLLRLAQGQIETAASMIAGALNEARERPLRCRLLPACVEVMLVRGDVAAARQAADELATLADDLDAPFLHACSAVARGAVLLADGDARAALGVLRDAATAWQALEAPYESARTRELIGVACRLLGDEERARLELDAAAWAYRQLGAALDLARLEHATDDTAAPGGLTPREVQLLRLLATGKTNRGIAEELVLSEKTVARHVSNIFTKLDVSSRAAATAYAYEHKLV